MKGYLSLLFGSLMIVFMLASPGTVAQANTVQPAPGDCDCPVTYIVGAEGNKWAAELLSSDAFAVAKTYAKDNGYQWNGADEMEIVSFNFNGAIMARAPFVNEAGIKEYAGFTYDGVTFTFKGIFPDTH